MVFIRKLILCGGTKYGGFGGIGVENWILQNGGSLIRAMQTFLEATINKDGQEIGFEEFKRKYPIYDFGQNHRFNGEKNDHYIEGLTKSGFEQIKMLFKELLKDREEKQPVTDKLGDSIIDIVKSADGYAFSDMSRIYGLLSQFRTHEIGKTAEVRGDEVI